MNKKMILLILIITFLTAFIMAGCGGNSKPELHKVNFIVDNAVYATLKTSGNTTIQLPQDPTKENYVFDGWYWDKDIWQQPFTINSLLNQPLSNDLNVYAKWINDNSVSGTEIRMTTFEQIGTFEFFTKVSNTTTLLSLSPFVEIDPQSTWILSTDYSGNNKITSKTASLKVGDNTYYITVFAKNNDVQLYTIKIRRKPIYTVQFNTNGGTDIQSQQIEEDDFATEPTPATSKTGYIFSGWDFDFANKIVNSLTINANWTPITYNLKFDSNNGTGQMTNQLLTYNVSQNINLNTFERLGYNFSHWNTKSDGTGTRYNNGASIRNISTTDNEIITLYAQWQIINYTISYDYNNWTGDIQNPTSYNIETDTITLNNPTSVISFTGWENDNKQFISTIPKGSTGNLKLKAIWDSQYDYLKYTLSPTTFSVTGVIDKSDTNLIIPNVVTSINRGAFNNYTNLNSITLPFIGESRTTNNYLGHIFGASSYSTNNSYVPSNLETVILLNITTIPEYAFYNCTKIKSIELPTSLISIEQYAFYGCKNLDTINISNSVTSIGGYSFYECTNLTAIDIPNSLNSIENFTFFGCSGLEDIEIPNTVTNIGQSSFYNCTSLTTINFPNSLKTIGSSAFYNCSGLQNIEIPNSVTSIYTSAFYGCTKLTSFTIPNTVTTIGRGILEQCSNLDNLSLPFIGSSILYNYPLGYIFDSTYNWNDDSYKDHKTYIPSSLKTIKITNASTIEENAFYECENIKNIEIANSVTNFGSSAFHGCNNIANVYYNGTLEQWMQIEFLTGAKSNPLYYGADLYIGNEKLINLTIPTSTTSIKNYTFWGCTSLQTLTMTNSINTIGEGAFWDCTSLQTLTMTNSINTIGEGAFGDCTNLKTLYYNGNIEQWLNIQFSSRGSNPLYNNSTLYIDNQELVNLIIPNSVTNINSYAFINCKSIETVKIPNFVTNIDTSAFEGCTGLKDIEISNSVTNIDTYAFYGCTGLKDIEIPDSVTHIGSSALYKCSNLESITLPFIGDGTKNKTHFGYIFGANEYSSNNAYVPSSLKSVKVTKAKSIGILAFYNCNSIKNIEIPNTVTTIGRDALERCLNLESLTLPFVGDNSANNPILGYIFGSNEYNNFETSNAYVPSSLKSVQLTNVTTIYDEAFMDCKNIESITIPSSVTYIGIGVFYGCTSLKSVYYQGTIKQWLSIKLYGTASNPLCYGADLYINNEKVVNLVIPNSVTSIKHAAFYGYTSLESITISNSVTSIGSSAFSDCISLESIIIPNSVTSIGSSAFSGCTSLKSVYYQGTIEQWLSIKLYDTDSNPLYYGADLYINNEKVVNLVIPNSVTSIGDYAFYGYRSFESITIPSSVTSIGDYAFHGYISCLETVFYEGTANEWDFINIGYDNNQLTYLLRYYYSETKPSAEGNFWRYVDGVPTIW